MFQPLKDVKVIDLSQVLAGPYATYLLALMGAEVIKVEKPGEGDWTRTNGTDADLSARKMGLGFLAQNAGKKSVELDLKSEKDLAAAKRLISDAAVFVENFKPGVAARLGLGFEAVRKVNPRIVYCSISAFGQDGPLSARPAYDHIIQGMCGIMKTTGKPGDGPNKVGAPYVDYATGMNGAMAIMAGLMEVARTGKAVHLDVAMLDTAMHLMASLVTQQMSSDWAPVQNGNEAWSASPSSGAFETADGTLMLAANNEPQFRNMCTTIGRADILSDPRWTDPATRKKNGGALRDTLVQSFLTRPAGEWETMLSQATVPAARIRGLEEVLAEDHLKARGLTSATTVAGHDKPVHVVNLSFKANGEVAAPRRPAVRLGADTDDILGSNAMPLRGERAG